jgi:hypothetical protein
MVKLAIAAVGFLGGSALGWMALILMDHGPPLTLFSALH